MTEERSWKQHHADQSERVFDVQMMQDVMAEFAENMGFTLDGLPKYGLMKVAGYAAQIARAQTLGIDPELLRMTPAETTSHQLWLAATAAFKGVPTYLIEADPDEQEDS